jgi:diguanylate cyclase (GGDEF)-like protein/PAS domain S-box-containing protein
MNMMGRMAGDVPADKGKRLRQWRTLPVVVLAIGIALSAGAWFAVDRYWDAAAEQAELNALGDSRLALVQEGLNDIDQSVNILSDYFEDANHRMSHSEFEFLSNVVIPRVQDWGQLSWVPRVGRDERAAEEASAAAEGLSDYRILTRRADGSLAPAPVQNEYFPVRYVAGKLGVPPLYGVDLGADPAAAAAMERARDDDVPVASPLYDLQIGGRNVLGISLFMPIYKYGLSYETLQDRRRNLMGFVRSVFAPSVVFEDILQKVKSPRGIDIQFFTVNAAADDLPFYVRSSLLRTTPAQPRSLGALQAGFHWSGVLSLGTARWKMVVVPIPHAPLAFERNRAGVVLLAGLLLTAMLAGYVYLAMQQRERLKAAIGDLSTVNTRLELEIARSRDTTARLQESQQIIAGILNTIPARIFWKDRNLVYLGCNAVFARDAGFASVEDVVGKDDYQMGWRDQADLYRGDDRQVIESGEDKLLIEEPQTTPDGHKITLLTNKIPLRGSNGEIVGVLGTYMDITERKKAAAAAEYRGVLLHALAGAAGELLTASSLDEGVPSALRIVGEAVEADRVLVLEEAIAPDGTPVPPAPRYGWHSPSAPVRVEAASFATTAPSGIERDPWFAPLHQGVPITNRISAATGAAKGMMEQLQIKSILVVPVMVDGKFWGQIGFDDCHAEREWTSVETDILRALSNLVGTAIVRARYVRELADANTIVQNSTTVLYRLRGEPSLPMTYISQNIRQFGYAPGALVAAPHLYRKTVHPDDEASVQAAMAGILRKGAGPAVIDFRMRTADGNYRWVENRYAPVCDAEGRLVEIEGVLTDITERKVAEEKLALLARTDPLTGLANRATFTDRLRLMFAAARRGAVAFAVLYLDIDRFKDINDTLGHPVGDELLKITAERIKGGIRDIDLVARLGGDEFAVLQTNVGDSADSGALAEKIRDAVSQPCQIEGNELHVTASVGISAYTPEIAGPEELLSRADLALYRAKEEGRDQYRFHSEELDAEVRERVQVGDELRLALGHNEFELHYQPQVEFETGEIVGMEALIRWNHPTRGLLMPGAFLAIAEKSGIMNAIGQWVLDRACQQMSDWKRQGIAPQTIAVNIALAQLKDGHDFVQHVTEALTHWQLLPTDLELDVTESIMAHATLTKNDMLDRLQKLGVKIAIDDFGSQYSSLDYLKTYRVNRLKLPQSMMEAAKRDARSAAMVRAIIGIAREMRVEIVAQGVETEQQWSFLTEAVPNLKVQGFYYSRPVPPDRAAALLRQKWIKTKSEPPERHGRARRAG